MSIADLYTVQLPESGRWVRDRAVPPENRRPDYDEKYDFRTLVYDAVLGHRGRTLHLICPKLLNLEELVRSGQFRINGRTVRAPRLLRRLRYDELVFRNAVGARDWSLELDDMTLSGGVHDGDTKAFEGLNCGVFISRNNDLQWIRDWARYHASVHGLQGMVVFDNASTDYALQDIGEALRGVAGLEAVRVVSTPTSYGPVGVGKMSARSLFLQTSVLNVARLRFFSRARAVLCCDCDELVAPIEGSTIFDQTVRSPIGYLLFRGKWVSEQTGGEVKSNHIDHTLSGPTDLCRNTKYCIAPKGLFGFSHWEVHGAVKGFLKNAMTREDLYYWHFRHLNTGWKGRKRGLPAKELAPDVLLTETLRAALPAE